MPYFFTQCSFCFAELRRHTSNKSKRYFCNNSCKKHFCTGKTLVELHGEEVAKRLIENLIVSNSGENNPNYGKKWTDEQKEVSRQRTTEVMKNPDVRFAAGSANRSKKFDDDRIHRMHGNRDPNSYGRRTWTDEQKHHTGKMSSAKWTDEFRKNFRKTMEDRGHWIPLSIKDEYKLYESMSNWIHAMYPLIEVDNSIDSPVRDHIIPRWVGYELGIFPEILRHPLNCQIISRSDNIKKGFVDRKIDINSWEIWTYELIENIIQYNDTWIEQNVAIDRCIAYLSGERWVNTFRKEEIL